MPRCRLRSDSPYAFPYPGDHQDKRAARLFLYKHALSSPRVGASVTLAGATPESEVELLRDYLKWPALHTWFVDNSNRKEVLSALRRVKRLWPKVNIYPGDLRDLTARLPAIGFANLDFMGHLNSFNVLPCLKLVIPLLTPDAILGLTWERGRELTHRPDSSGMRTLREGSQYSDINDRRWAGVMKIVNNIAKGKLTVVGGVEYQNNHSPMSITVFKKRV